MYACIYRYVYIGQVQQQTGKKKSGKLTSKNKNHNNSGAEGLATTETVIGGTSIRSLLTL